MDMVGGRERDMDMVVVVLAAVAFLPSERVVPSTARWPPSPSAPRRLYQLNGLGILFEVSSSPTPLSAFWYFLFIAFDDRCGK